MQPRDRALAIGDQILSGGSNFLAVVAVARSADPAELGRFAATWTVFVFLLALSRGALSLPISLSAATPSKTHGEVGFALGVLWTGAPIVIGVLWLFPMMLGGPDTVAVLIVAAPLALAQDLLRAHGFATQRIGRTFVSDLAWLLIALTGVSSYWVAWGLPALTAWAAGAAVAMCLLAIGGPRPRFKGIRHWLVDRWRDRAHLASAAIIASLAVALATSLITVLSGPAVTATLAGLGQLFTPTNTLLALLPVAVLPTLMRRKPAQRLRSFAALAAMIAATTALWGALLLTIPTSWGEAIIGETWLLTRAVLPLGTVQYAIGVFAVSVGVLLASLRLAHMVSLQSAALGVGRLVNAAAISLAVGTATALVLGEAAVLAVAAAIGWIRAKRFVRRHPTPAAFPVAFASSEGSGHAHRRGGDGELTVE